MNKLKEVAKLIYLREALYDATSTIRNLHLKDEDATVFRRGINDKVDSAQLKEQMKELGDEIEFADISSYERPNDLH